MNNDTAILAPAFYPNLYPVRHLRDSAQKYGVPVKFYGTGRPYHHWFHTQVTYLIPEIMEAQNAGFENVLYTDASDAIFLSDLALIESTYRHAGSPDVLFSCEHGAELCAGGWMGKIEPVLEALRLIADMGEANPQDSWRTLHRDGLARISPDITRQLFQTVEDYLEVRDGQIYNPITRSYPKILHWNGGYTDPIDGKDAIMLPLIKRLEGE